jgi:argonaute-like protein implicated in RNA metabolism and viral defense
VIETSDGILINRSMSTVKRVTIENGQVVVVGRDGKIERVLLANVVRMSISP